MEVPRGPRFLKTGTPQSTSHVCVCALCGPWGRPRCKHMVPATASWGLASLLVASKLVVHTTTGAYAIQQGERTSPG